MSTLGVRTGRPASGGDNRSAILIAARQEFATAGFGGATLRSIAARAGVDVALLSHYFGNKDGLFAATLELPDGIREAFIAALSGPSADRGERVTRWYLGLWEDPATAKQMQVLARSALSNTAAAERVRDLLGGATDGPGFDDVIEHDRVGMALAMTQLLGISVARYLTHVPPLADMDFEALVARTAPAVQLHLSAPA